MTIFEIPVELRKAADLLDNIDDINCGGCGIAALALLRFCQARNIHARVEYMYRSTTTADDMEANNLAALGEPVSPMACSHAAIRLLDLDVLFDSTGVLHDYQIEDYDLGPHPLPERIVVESVKNQSNWNGCFDRSLVPFISQSLNVDLSDIDSSGFSW